MQHGNKVELANKMEEQSRCVCVVGEWLGRGNTPGEVVGFGRGNRMGLGSCYVLLTVAKED